MVKTKRLNRETLQTLKIILRQKQAVKTFSWPQNVIFDVHCQNVFFSILMFFVLVLDPGRSPGRAKKFS